MAKKTVSQSIQEQSNVELLPERNEIGCKECSCGSWYTNFWFWIVVLFLVISGVYWYFFY